MFTQLFTQFWAGLSGQRRDQVIHYQYRADWACRTLRGIDEQIAKAERPLPARPPSSATGSSTWPAAPAPSTGPRRPRPSRGGLKGYVTNLATCPDGTPVTAQFVIDAYHRLVQIEKSFRMSKHDLQAPPIYHRQRDSTDAHLTIMFSALAVSHWIEDRTGWSIRKFVRTACRYRTIEIQAGANTVTAVDPAASDAEKITDGIRFPGSPGLRLSCSRRTDLPPMV